MFCFLPKKIRDVYSSLFGNQLLSGENACYAAASKKVVLPEKGLALSAFHEVGHALNSNFGRISKLLQKTRFLTVLSLPIAGIALFKTKKAPNQEPNGKLDKATTFIKNNAGKLTFATFLPVLLEEGIATIKGNKIAKQTLNADLAKKVSRTNGVAFLSYLSLAALSGVGIYLGTKLKGAIAKPKPIKSTEVTQPEEV